MCIYTSSHLFNKRSTVELGSIYVCTTQQVIEGGLWKYKW